MIYNACQLRVFDALEKFYRPATAEELANKLNLQGDKLERLLSACVPLGLLSKERELVDGVEKGQFQGHSTGLQCDSLLCGRQCDFIPEGSHELKLVKPTFYMQI